MRTGTAIYRAAGESHSDRYDGDGAYVCVAIAPGSDMDVAHAALGGDTRVVRRPQLRAIGMRCAAEILSVVRRRAPSIASSKFCTVTLPRIYRSNASPLPSARARRTSRAFRRHAGVGIAEYVRGVRIEHARVMLSSGAKPVAEIAAQTAFYDQSHVNRAFRKVFGVTPVAYRRERRR